MSVLRESGEIQDPELPRVYVPAGKWRSMQRPPKASRHHSQRISGGGGSSLFCGCGPQAKKDDSTLPLCFHGVRCASCTAGSRAARRLPSARGRHFTTGIVDGLRSPWWTDFGDLRLDVEPIGHDIRRLEAAHQVKTGRIPLGGQRTSAPRSDDPADRGSRYRKPQALPWPATQCSLGGSRHVWARAEAVHPLRRLVCIPSPALIERRS